MSFGQSEILVDAENKVPSVTAIRYSSPSPQLAMNIYLHFLPAAWKSKVHMHFI